MLLYLYRQRIILTQIGDNMLNTPLSQKNKKTIKIEKKKSLFANGEIKESVSISKTIITDISKKNKVLKSYKFQFDNLGFIVQGGQVINTKAPISEIIHSQINKNDVSFFKDDKSNARNTVLGYFRKPELLQQNARLFSCFVNAMDSKYNTGKSKNNCPHTALISRLFRKNKGEAIYKRIEELQGL